MSFVRSLLTSAAALTLAATANAQTFTTGGTASGFTSRNASSAPAQGVTLASNMNITSFALWIGTETNQTMKFFIMDRALGTTVFSQEKLVTARSAGTYTSSDPFSMLLTAGRTYDFGVIGSQANLVAFIVPVSSLTMNGISLAGPNANYGDYNSLNFGGTAGATIALEINAGPASVVPEPSTYALMATGFIGLVGVARRRNA